MKRGWGEGRWSMCRVNRYRGRKGGSEEGGAEGLSISLHPLLLYTSFVPLPSLPHFRGERGVEGERKGKDRKLRLLATVLPTYHPTSQCCYGNLIKVWSSHTIIQAPAKWIVSSYFRPAMSHGPIRLWGRGNACKSDWSAAKTLVSSYLQSMWRTSSYKGTNRSCRHHGTSWNRQQRHFIDVKELTPELWHVQTHVTVVTMQDVK